MIPMMITLKVSPLPLEIDMKDIIPTNAIYEARIKKLEKYRDMVHYIVNDYHELSHEKATWQRDDWKMKCKKLLEELE